MLNKILAATAGIIASIILIVTVTTFAVRGCDSSSSEKKSSQRKTPSMFELGQIRISLKADEGTSVAVIDPCMSFSKNDESLYEEILQKQLKIKEEISKQISQYSREELKSKGELLIKDELVKCINRQLVMGKIDSIYFKKFIYID